MNYIREYVKAIDDGLVVSKKVAKVYRNILKDIEDGKYILNEAMGERPIRFAEMFCVPKDSKTGKTIKLELFQKAFLQAAFGIYTHEGKRRFREIFLLIARKNGKTTLLSIVMLYLLVSDGENGAEIYSIATKLDQAKKSFKECIAMVSKSPELRRILKKRQSDIYSPTTFGFIQPLASDSNTLDSLNSHGVVMDELHAITKRELYDVMIESMGARDNPMFVMITTAGTVRESIFDDIYKHANKVLEGIVEDESFLAVMYEMDERDEWMIEECWPKSNPGIGTIKKVDYLRKRVKRALDDISGQASTLTKEFNILGVSASAWLEGSTIFNKATFELEHLRDCYATGGADLSSTTDLTCATLMVEKEGIKYVLQQYFMPEESIDQRADEDKVPYRTWAERGLLTLCEGVRVSYEDVTRWFVKMRDIHGIYPLWVGYDKWNANYWVEEMKRCGFTMEPVIQGALTMSAPMKDLKADLKAKLINYNFNPILIWCLSNTVIKTDENDNIRPVKGRNQRARIDGTVSLIDAYVVYSKNRENYINMTR